MAEVKESEFTTGMVVYSQGLNEWCLPCLTVGTIETVERNEQGELISLVLATGGIRIRLQRHGTYNPFTGFYLNRAEAQAEVTRAYNMHARPEWHRSNPA
jgi:hypothetical protein